MATFRFGQFGHEIYQIIRMRFTREKGNNKKWECKSGPNEYTDRRRNILAARLEMNGRSKEDVNKHLNRDNKIKYENEPSEIQNNGWPFSSWHI